MKKLVTLLTIALALLTQPLFATTLNPPKKHAMKGMVKHIVLFKFKPETTPEKLAEILAAFQRRVVAAPEAEFSEALRQIERIAQLRIEAKMAS